MAKKAELITDEYGASFDPGGPVYRPFLGIHRLDPADGGGWAAVAMTEDRTEIRLELRRKDVRRFAIALLNALEADK